jgi:hypothetical protein
MGSCVSRQNSSSAFFSRQNSEVIVETSSFNALLEDEIPAERIRETTLVLDDKAFKNAFGSQRIYRRSRSDGIPKSILEFSFNSGKKDNVTASISTTPTPSMNNTTTRDRSTPGSIGTYDNVKNRELQINTGGGGYSKKVILGGMACLCIGLVTIHYPSILLGILIIACILCAF